MPQILTSINWAKYRKTLVGVVGAVLSLLTSLSTLGDVIPSAYARWIGVAIAVLTVVATYLTPNALDGVAEPVQVKELRSTLTALVPSPHRDLGSIKLGRLPKPHDPRDLLLKNYLTLPKPPVAVDNSGLVKSWGMLLNDQLGDCTIAAALHAVMVWRKLAGSSFKPTNAMALKGYELACGYDPADPSTDQGGVERDVLKFWQKTGFGGHKIAAFAAVDPKNESEILSTLSLLGVVYLGVDLEKAQQSGQTWDYVKGSPEWGGHAIPLVAWDSVSHTGIVVSWGGLYRVTAAFMQHCCEEAWAVLSPDELNGKGVTSQGLDLAALRADLAAL